MYGNLTRYLYQEVNKHVFYFDLLLTNYIFPN